MVSQQRSPARDRETAARPGGRSVAESSLAPSHSQGPLHTALTAGYEDQEAPNRPSARKAGGVIQSESEGIGQPVVLEQRARILPSSAWCPVGCRPTLGAHLLYSVH